MIRPWRVAAALVVGLVACEESAGPTGGGAGVLMLEIAPSPSGGATHLDSGYVRVHGPTEAAVKATPGQPVTIAGLTPGTYTVELEGYDLGGLAYFGQASGVVVRGGQTTTATPSFDPLRLAFQVQPFTTRTGRGITPPVEVGIADPSGSIITRATNSVTVALRPNVSGASLSGAQTVSAVNGVASFSNLSVSETGNGYDLIATSGSLIQDTSAVFDATFDLAVPNTTSNTVSRIQTATGSVVANVPTAAAPAYAAFTPDGGRLYVTNSNANSTQVFNMANNALLTTIPVGSLPQGIAMSPDGSAALVANSNSNTVSRISTATDSVTATTTVGTFPIGVAITPDGNKAFVSNLNSGTVSVLDARTGALITTVTVGGNPFGVAVNPSGTEAWVSNYASGAGTTVAIINTSNYTIAGSATVGSGPVGIGFTPDGVFAYVANSQSNSVTVIRAANRTLVTTVTVGSNPLGVAMSPGGKFAYVSNLQASSVTVIATATNTQLTTIAVQSQPRGIATPLR